MEKRWIQAVGQMTYGIYVLTTVFEETINGMIASWVSMVSYDPPLIMVAVHTNRFSHGLIEKSGKFALNVLANDQHAYLSQFKGSDPKAKFAGIGWKKGKTGCPILTEGIGYIDCVIEKHYKPGNHTLFIGKIVDAKALAKKAPLCTLDYEGVYLGKN